MINKEDFNWAFNRAARIVINSPVPIDTLPFRKAFLALKKEEREKMGKYISYRFSKLNGLRLTALKHVRASEFGSDYYHKPTSRGPYNCCARQLIGGIMLITSVPQSKPLKIAQEKEEEINFSYQDALDLFFPNLTKDEIEELLPARIPT